MRIDFNDGIVRSHHALEWPLQDFACAGLRSLSIFDHRTDGARHGQSVAYAIERGEQPCRKRQFSLPPLANIGQDQGARLFVIPDCFVADWDILTENVELALSTRCGLSERPIPVIHR